MKTGFTRSELEQCGQVIELTLWDCRIMLIANYSTLLFPLLRCTCSVCGRMQVKSYKKQQYNLLVVSALDTTTVTMRNSGGDGWWSGLGGWKWLCSTITRVKQFTSGVLRNYFVCKALLTGNNWNFCRIVFSTVLSLSFCSPSVCACAALLKGI